MHGNTLRAGLSRRPGLKLFCAAAICLLVSFAAGASSFTATLDRDTISLGESATLSLKFDGVQPENVAPPNVPGLQFANPAYFRSDIDNNGQRSSGLTVSYTIVPQQTGDFEIPPIEIDVGGQHLATQPLKLTVVKPSAPTTAQINSGSQIAFMRLVVAKDKVYPGQIVPAQLQFFFRDDVQHFSDIQITGQPTDGFSIGKIVGNGQGQRIQVGNHTYTVVSGSVELTVTKTGTVSVGPFTGSAVILTGADQSFGPFGYMGGQQRQVSMATETATAVSFPLPTDNVPPGFNGAVGDYTMSVNAGPTNVAVGDPITVHVQISGQGSVDSLLLPNQTNWDGFKIFPPTSKVQLSDDLGDEGSKTFEQIVTPQDAKIHELPPLSFSFFSPRDGNYHTLTQPATPLTVTPVSATPLPTVATAAKPASNENQTPQDIVNIRENLGEIMQPGTPLVTRPAFLALQGIPLVAFIAALVWRRRTDNLANNPRLRRQRAVAQLIAGGLDDLNKFASENKSNEFFAMLFRLLQELLGERLDCPAISITEADADNRLLALGAKPETFNELRELFHACNQARYAPIQTSQELSALAAKFKKVAAELQNLKT